MADRPKLLCPQCGADLRGVSGQACPECGYCIALARVHFRGALRYWRLLRSRRWIEVITTLLWLGGVGFGVWLISFAPVEAIVLLTVAAGASVVGLGRYLGFRRKKKR